MEVMLVDDGAADQPLWAEHEVQRFAHGRFADVVAADQERVPNKIDNTFGYTPEI
jgi:hypothetical protein